MTVPAPTAQTDWRLVLFALGCGVLGALQVGKVPLALPAIRAEFGLDLAAGGFVASLFNLVGALFGFATGLAADRIGHRRAALAGLVLLAIGSAAGGLAASAAALYGARFVEGVGFVLVIVAAPALIARASAPGHLRLALGLWGTYMPAGMTVIMVLFPLLSAQTDWHGIWLLNGAVAVAFALLFEAATRTAPLARAAPGQPRTFAASTAVLRNKGAWLLTATFACYTIQWMGLMTWLPTILLDDMGMTPGPVALFTATAVAVSILGNLGAGWVLQRGAPHWLTLTIGHAAMGGGAWCLFQTGFPDGIRLGAVIVFSLVGGAVPASMFSSVLHHVRSPSLVGAANGMLVQGNHVGSFSGAPVLGALAAAAGGWQSLGTVLPGLAVAAIVFAVALRRLDLRSDGLTR